MPDIIKFAVSKPPALKILIVDDEQLDLFITKKLLSLEYEVEGFTSLAATVEWASKNTFDVLLSDYYLGQGHHAPDVLKALLQMKGKTFRSLVLTNHVDQGQEEMLKAAGFDSIIEKPITLEKFKECL